MSLLVRISASIGVIFLKIHTSRPTHAPKQCKFSCSWWIKKHYACERVCIFGCFSFSFRGIFEKSYFAHPYACTTKTTRLVVIENNKGYLLVKQYAFSALSRLLLVRFSRKLIPRTLHTCASNREHLFAVGKELRTLYLESNVPFRLYLDVHCKGFFLNIYITHSPRMPYKRYKFLYEL